MEQNLYKKLLTRKKQGEKLEWNDITKEELETLFKEVPDSVIAELYEVTKSQVTTKRKKWDIKQINFTIEKILNDSKTNKALFEALNQESKKRLLQEDNIDTISIALTHYLEMGRLKTCTVMENCHKKI